MTLNYTIEDLQGLEFKVDFVFHRELDGMLVFDGAWDIQEIIGDDGDSISIGSIPNADQMVHRWLSAGGEDRIYISAEREFVR